MDLHLHVDFCVRALKEDRSADVILPQNSGRIPIWKRKLKTKEDRLEVQLSAGHLDRGAIQRVAEDLDEIGIEFKRSYTAKRKKLSRITTIHGANSLSTNDEILKIIKLVSNYLNISTGIFSIEYLGSVSEDYVIQEDDPVRLSSSYKAGKAIGRKIGAVFSIFN